MKNLSCGLFLALGTLSLSAHAGDPVSATVRGEDWFFQSNACDKAHDNVKEELEDACRFRGDPFLASWDSDLSCSCTQNTSQPIWVCTVEARGECGDAEPPTGR